MTGLLTRSHSPPFLLWLVFLSPLTWRFLLLPDLRTFGFFLWWMGSGLGYWTNGKGLVGSYRVLVSGWWQVKVIWTQFWLLRYFIKVCDNLNLLDGKNIFFLCSLICWRKFSGSYEEHWGQLAKRTS